jgi:hypothetical protein
MHAFLDSADRRSKNRLSGVDSLDTCVRLNSMSSARTWTAIRPPEVALSWPSAASMPVMRPSES